MQYPDSVKTRVVFGTLFEITLISKVAKNTSGQRNVYFILRAIALTLRQRFTLNWQTK